MQFSFHLFILLFGFVIGNLFPTFFGDFLGKVGTPLFLFLALDFFNYFYYTQPVSRVASNEVGSSPLRGPMKRAQNSEQASNLKFQQTPRRGVRRLKRQTSFLSSFSAQANSFKIGFLFGLFVDAFKVGS